MTTPQLPVVAPEPPTVEDVRAVLFEARRILEDPTRWTRRAMARREDGQSVQSTDAKAAKWCLSGAIARAADAYPSRAALRYIAATSIVMATGDLPPVWNDRRTHEEVLQALDLAMEKVPGVIAGLSLYRPRALADGVDPYASEPPGATSQEVSNDEDC